MAKMHVSVLGANGSIIGRRVDENNGLNVSAPTALSISTNTLDISNTLESSTFFPVGAGTIKTITGGVVGQRLTIASSTGGTVTIYNSTGGTGHNIKYQAANSGTIVIHNVYHTVTLLKMTTGTYAWTVTGSQST
jgi:hypothetical protein